MYIFSIIGKINHNDYNIKEYFMEKNKVKLLSIGLITGLVNGLFGSGGGTLVVPFLVFLLHIDDHKAHATAISIILPLSIISTIIYFVKGSINFKVALPVVLGGVIGSYIGAKVLNKIPVNILRKIFGSVIIYTAIRMIWK
ncbi:sulfite exporter TauE/SafE family protein [Tissierella pigra]|nr:sulfite exporter TauE/SafE family protein [Tissierella pigra]MBU5427053.1 sulfite exporter TauE/SafE family protein [Tissierella pigra]